MSDTRDSIMAMTPEQLREAIAKAKGWFQYQDLENPHSAPASNCYNWWYVFENENWKWTSHIPDWPTNIADAMDLFDEVQVEPFEQAVFIGREVALSSDWHCYIGVHCSTAPTAPLAISRAYLLFKNRMSYEA